jgi:hypothetical protein
VLRNRSKEINLEYTVLDKCKVLFQYYFDKVNTRSTIAQYAGYIQDLMENCLLYGIGLTVLENFDDGNSIWKEIFLHTN